MLAFAQELAQVVRDIRSFDEMAVKVASVDSAMDAQSTKAAAAYALYAVMEKKASELFPAEPAIDRFVGLVEKAASCLGKQEFTPEDRWKLAAAVAADEALTAVLSTTDDLVERTKLAEQRSYGREFIVELIGKAL